MDYNFDEIIDRKNTDSLKYDFARRRGKPEGILPLWVADMDFKTPPCVTETLVDKARHGIFGYTESSEDYDEILQNWFFRNFNWEIQRNWLIKIPGITYAICAAIRTLTETGDSILIQQPVYYPFESSVTDNGRSLVVNQLLYRDGKYSIDFEDFETKIIENQVKLFLLCSPHNPVGRVWRKDELIRMGNICLKHNVIVVSDEIHADFTYPGYQHFVFASLKPGFQDISITCTAPTKTFNLAGLQISNIFIPNQAIRRRFRHEIGRTGYSQLNIMGIVACKAAYLKGDDWLSDLKAYLKTNLDFLKNFLEYRIPQIRLVEPEGTFLAWLDCQALGLTNRQLDDFIVQKAGLWLDDGPIFGLGGKGFQRINIACPKETLEKALIQLEEAINELKN